MPLLSQGEAQAALGVTGLCSPVSLTMNALSMISNPQYSLSSAFDTNRTRACSSSSSTFGNTRDDNNSYSYSVYTPIKGAICPSYSLTQYVRARQQGLDGTQIANLQLTPTLTHTPEMNQTIRSIATWVGHRSGSGTYDSTTHASMNSMGLLFSNTRPISMSTFSNDPNYFSKMFNSYYPTAVLTTTYGYWRMRTNVSGTRSIYYEPTSTGHVLSLNGYSNTDGFEKVLIYEPWKARLWHRVMNYTNGVNTSYEVFQPDANGSIVFVPSTNFNAIRLNINPAFQMIAPITVAGKTVYRFRNRSNTAEVYEVNSVGTDFEFFRMGTSYWVWKKRADLAWSSFTLANRKRINGALVTPFTTVAGTDKRVGRGSIGFMPTDIILSGGNHVFLMNTNIQAPDGHFVKPNGVTLKLRSMAGLGL